MPRGKLKCNEIKNWEIKEIVYVALYQCLHDPYNINSIFLNLKRMDEIGQYMKINAILNIPDCIKSQDFIIHWLV